MLFRLSRVSFWFTAAVGALGLLAPRGRESLLMTLTLVGSALAFALWRAAVLTQRREAARPRRAVEPLALNQASLLDAATLLVREAHRAGSFDAALHAVGQVLRSELGARQLTVYEVLEIDDRQALVAELIASQPGFQTVPRRVPCDASALGKALRDAREIGAAPGAAAIPIVGVTPIGAVRVVAAIELIGIELTIEPKALADVLELARLTLARLAPATAPAAPGPQRDVAVAGAPAAIDPRAVPAGGAQGRVDPTGDSPVSGAAVLVVEDNVVQPETTARLLRRLGCRVTVASGMLEGLHALCKTQFDLVLMDMQMAGWGAAEGLKWLRRNPGGAFGFVSPHDTPVIALTGPGLPSDGERLRELGFDDHLSKPCRRGEMLAMLSKHLRLHAPAEDDAVASGSVPTVAPAVEPRPAVLDEAALARLSELDPKGENRLLERVLRAFQGSVARLRPQIDNARASGDRAGVRLVAHTLKSSSASIGAMQLSQLCAQIESAIRLNAEDDLEALLDAFGVALDESLQAIDWLLKERA
jgi:CheY-like chemotaxis protein/HPt (histidine-containing phosphotransfer) domain-containing protein